LGLSRRDILVRLLIVSQYFHPENFGINDIAYDLRKSGHEVTVLTGMPNYPSGRIALGYRWPPVRREVVRGVDVVRVPLIPRGNGSFWRLALNYLSFAFTASILAPFLLRGPVDAIFVYQVSPLTVGLPALLVGWFKRAPIVFWVQDIWPETLVAVNSIKSVAILGIIRRLAAFTYRRCSMILIQSRAFEGQIRALGVPDADIRYFPNTVADHYHQASAAQEFADRELLPDGFNVLFAGNMGASQDFDTILDAAALLRDSRAIHWVIVGDGRMAPWVAAQIAQRKLGDNVHLLGPQPCERMPQLFAGADGLLVTLRPSCISGLTVPSKLQSYLACGRPIIGGIDGEAARIITESQAGVICSPGKPQELADAVLRLYRMTPGQREAMGSLGRRYFQQHFGRAELMERLAGWLAAAAAGKTSKGGPQPDFVRLHRSSADQA
jgi:colanic acid biosynthesis glycosyl transferase WcaI